MSHLSTLQTEIRSLDIAALALAQLGVPFQRKEGLWISFYYDQQEKIPVDLTIGSAGGYQMGLRENPEKPGTYELIGDIWGCNTRGEWLESLGPGFSKWTWASQKMPNGRTMEGHVGTGKPTALLREYAMQTGYIMAQQYAMHAERVPADQTADECEPGSEKLILTGGHLPPGQSMHLICQPDGTIKVRYDGASDHSCYLYTKPLEDALGRLLTDVSTLDLAHQSVQGRTHHIARH